MPAGLDGSLAGAREKMRMQADVAKKHEELNVEERQLELLRTVASAAHVVVGLGFLLAGILCRLNGTGF